MIFREISVLEASGITPDELKEKTEKLQKEHVRTQLCVNTYIHTLTILIISIKNIITLICVNTYTDSIGYINQK